MADRGRTRERTPKPSKPSNTTTVTTAPQMTQLPPVGNHHQVLEQPVAATSPTKNNITTTRTDSSDAEKKPPEPKKMKLEKNEPETQPDTPMEPAPATVTHNQVFGPREVFDLTQGDEAEDCDELKQCEEPTGPPTAPKQGPFPNLPRPPSGSGTSESMPEWLKALSDSLQGLHVKSDRTHEYCVQLGSSVAQHDTRLAHLEAVAKEHTENHENNTDRITALEQAVTELDRKLRSCTPPRSAPGTPRSARGNVSPRSPRGGQDLPPGTIGAVRDPMQDLGLVVGGWSDARVTEAEEEVRNLFKAANLSDALESMSGPAGRTNFLRVTLNFKNMNDWQTKRQHQTKVLQKLKSMSTKSGIEGQDGCALWVTKDRTVEERIRIRALVLTKNFYEKLPALEQGPSRWPDPEIVWRGQVFIGQVRMLRNADEFEPAPYDQIIEDARGNHTIWYLSADSYAKVTGRDKESLQQAWLDFGPSASPNGVSLGAA